MFETTENPDSEETANDLCDLTGVEATENPDTEETVTELSDLTGVDNQTEHSEHERPTVQNVWFRGAGRQSRLEEIAEEEENTSEMLSLTADVDNCISEGSGPHDTNSPSYHMNHTSWFRSGSVDVMRSTAPWFRQLRRPTTAVQRRTTLQDRRRGSNAWFRGPQQGTDSPVSDPSFHRRSGGVHGHDRWACQHKLGSWRGGCAQETANAAQEQLCTAIAKWLDATENDCEISKEILEADEVMTKLHNEMASDEFYLGNPFVWMFSCCNTPPERRTLAFVQQLQDSGPQAHPELLQEIRTACHDLKSKRQAAKHFIQMYGPWFRRFVPKHKWSEPILLVYMLLFSLALGPLQHRPYEQAVFCTVLSTVLTVYFAKVRPFNEASRFYFETASNICLMLAIATIAVHIFSEATDPSDVDILVTSLTLGSLFFKTAYHIFHVFPFYKTLINRACKSHKKVVEHSDVGDDREDVHSCSVCKRKTISK